MHAICRLVVIVFLACAAPAWAGEADVIRAEVGKGSSGPYDFDVTIRSNDRGLDYYCDRFEVLGPDGKALGVRIAAGIRKVTIRARHKPRGYDGETLAVTLT